jgi:hypothetical protein
VAVKWTQSTLQSLIDSETQESLNLDYKSAAALGKTDGKRADITKDVSALANSDGGTIIYGIAEFQQPEKKHLPEKLDPVDQAVFTREWLEQIINIIRPRLDGVVITPVPLNTGPNHVVYVVEVPKGTTAHQASDKRYYKRFNFQSVPMEDYEIKDVMGRLQHPRIELAFLIQIESERLPGFVIGLDYDLSYRTKCVLKIIAKNTGPVYAKYVNTLVTFHHELLSEEAQEDKEAHVDDGQLLYTEEFDNTVSDQIGFDARRPQYGPRRFYPILPGLSHTWEIELTTKLPELGRLRDDVVVKWQVYADNSSPSAGQIAVNEIPRIDKRPLKLG